MSLQPTTATIVATSPRAAVWAAVFGGTTVEIESPLPVRGLKPDGTAADFYKVRVKSLTPEQRHRLAVHMAEKFGVDAADVQHELDGPHGCPILAEDVYVAADLRLFV